MHRNALFILLPLAGVLLGCGGGGGGEQGATPGATTSSSSSSGADPSAESLDLSLTTGEFDAPPGDSFECFYFDKVTDKEMSLASALGKQGPGGHHIVVYYTDVHRKPGHHPCDDAEMVSWHQVAASGNEGTGAGTIDLPDGLANRVPAGKQIVLQSHYINTTGVTQKVNDSITVHGVPPSSVKAYVNQFVVVDAGFSVPAQGTQTHTTTCMVPRDLDTVLMLGHMHEHGKHYKLEHLVGDAFETLYDEDWTPEYTSHPPVIRHTMEQPLVLTKGEKLRQTCTWDNTTAAPLLFPREMCVAFFYYFPDAGGLECELDKP